LFGIAKLLLFFILTKFLYFCTLKVLLMKIINIEDINILDRETMVTVGMFDGLHLGHRHLLATLSEQSKKRDLTPIVVTFDRHPRQVLHPESPMQLLSTADERMQMLADFGVETVAMVNFDVEAASMSACRFAENYLCSRLAMKTLLLGYDNSFGSKSNDDFARLPEVAERHGFDILHDSAVFVNDVDVSSTKIRRALQQGDIEAANAMLGYPYRFSGHVVHGRHIGTGLGFPTANLVSDDRNKLLPANGVYALRAMVDGVTWPAMANLGMQPTFDGHQSAFEVHLIGFDKDLYGRQITVEFVGRIRDIKPFSSPMELKAQLMKDSVDAMNMTKK